MNSPSWRWNRDEPDMHLGRGEELEHRALCGADILTAGFSHDCPADHACSKCLSLADRYGMQIPLVTPSQRRCNSTQGLGL